MIGIDRFHVIILVATPAVGGSSRELSIDVTFLAGNGIMLSGQGKSCIVVVESGGSPRGHSMTLEAILVELPGGVARVGDSGVISLMTTPAVGGSSREEAVLVAALAGGGLVGALQGIGSIVMVEGRRNPPQVGVALGAVVIELGGGMIGI